MQIPLELIPMFITLTGARDRAKHEQKKIGNVYCRATTEITLMGIVRGCSATNRPHPTASTNHHRSHHQNNGE